MNCPAHQTRGFFFGLFLIDDFGEVLHQANDVTHAQDASSHAFGAELLEFVAGFTHTREYDGGTRDVFDGQRRATTRVTVEFRQDTAGDR